MPNFIDLIKGGSLERNQQKIYGVAVAIVTDNNDPEKLYRVKVRYPWQANGTEENSFWARIATFGAGKDRGMFILPEVQDEVLVAFEHGDISHPYVIGSLWNSQQTTHLDNDKQDGKNHKRVFKSRSGHYLEFDDNHDDKVEAITLQTKAGAKMRLDDKDGALKCEIVDSTGENYLLLDTENKKITLETSSGDMLIKAKNEIKIECKTLNVKSDQETNFDAGTNWNAKAGSNFTLEASGGTGLVKSSGVLTIKGSMVNIN